MLRRRRVRLTPLLAAVAIGCAPPDDPAPEVQGEEGDATAPALSAEIFAPDVISSAGANETWITFTADGAEAIFSRYDDDFNAQTLYSTRRSGAGWAPARPLPLSGSYGDRAAYVAPDGRLFFSSDRPASAGEASGTWRIWVAVREGEGWGTPEPLPAPVNAAGDYHAAVAADGTLFWASPGRPDGLGRSDLYVAAPSGAGYGPVRHLPPPLNTATSEPDVYVDPEQRYLILTVTDRAGGRGGDDLWVSRRAGDSWAEPVHLGDPVNTPEYEYGPYVHDGWLYFTSHRSGQADIYRVRLADLPALEEFATDAGGAGFVSRDVEVGGRRIPVTVQLPPDFDAGRAWPAILALHGGGSRGTDGLRHRGQSVAAAARLWPERYPAILVLPQIPDGTWWLNGYLPGAEAALDLAAREFRLDRHRTYVVGQSMGAAGALALAARDPDRYAAAIAVAGPNPGSLDVAALRDLPVWLFHGARDPVVAPEEARGLLRRLREAGVEARLTEYPEGRHDIFDAVYGDAEVSAWLMEQRRGD